MRLADREPGGVVARDVLDRLERVAAGDLDLAHVADVEEARARSGPPDARATMPEYSTGMSQPPNSTMRAPSDRWRALSGVFLSVPESA